MLERLTIQNYALIESIDIEFPDGLIILTGETGAGKSVLLGAVSLLAGSKADSAIFRSADKNCVVEGVFSAKGKQTIIRRVISPSLRSRAFIDDMPVSVAELEKTASSLLDIHSQHGNLMLGNQKFQLSALDGFCANTSLLEKYRGEYEAVKSLEKRSEVLEQQIAEYKREASQRLSELNQLEEAQLVEGELEKLEAELRQLENAQMLMEHSSAALSLLEQADDSVVNNLREALKNTQKCAEVVPSIEVLAKRIESCRIECKDIAADIEKFSGSIIYSPQRIKQLEDRLGTIYSLMRRFSCADMPALIEFRDRLKNGEEDIGKLEMERETVISELAVKRQNREQLAKKLTTNRRTGAAKMQEVLVKSIRSLEMPSAQFTIEVKPFGEYTLDGCDVVRFLFTANPKEKEVELSRVASGGELSRIMLCLKDVMASYMQMPTLFFDEIDVGVSGSIADKMGMKIVEMGGKTQVFAITHLPQVASKGKAHFLVYKEVGASERATICIKALDSKERVLEIARLLSGEKTTPQAIANAKVLLENN